MNYKIRITAENQAIVKRIADENNMNNGEEYHYYIGYYLITDGNKIRNFAQQANFQEITTEQFIELFDKKESLVGRWFQALEDNAAGAPTIKNSYYQIKEGHQEGFLFLVPTFSDPNFLFGLSKEQENKHFKLMPKDFQPTQETELDKWLKETKAKNLTEIELEDYIDEFMPFSMYHKVRSELNVSHVEDVAKALFNQWQKEKEFSPKIIGYKAPFDLFNGYIKKGHLFIEWTKKNYYSAVNENVSTYSLPKEIVETWEAEIEPLPTEQPKKPDFKSQVIELIEYRMKINNEKKDACYDGKDAYAALNFEICNSELEDVLEQVKNLC